MPSGCCGGDLIVCLNDSALIRKLVSQCRRRGKWPRGTPPIYLELIDSVPPQISARSTSSEAFLLLVEVVAMVGNGCAAQFMRVTIVVVAGGMELGK
jgi:hypothetical protein